MSGPFRAVAATLLLGLAACLDSTPTEPGGAAAPGELVPATAWLEVGGTLTMTLGDDQPFTLESGDRSVVTVERDGRIRAVGVGRTELRAFTRGGRSVASVSVLPATPRRRITVVDSGLTDVSLLGIWSVDAAVSYAVGILGVLLETTDGGASWRRVPLGTDDDLVGVWASSRSDVWAVGEAGAAYHYDGATWTRQQTGAGFTLLEVWGLGPDHVYAVGAGGAVQYDGVSWRPMSGAEGAELWAVWGTHPDTLFASGQNGVILRWDGGRWRAMTSGTNRILFGLYGDAADDVYAAGIRGTFLHFDGDAWAPAPLPSGADFFALAGWGRNLLTVVGNNGAIMLRNGGTWTFVPPIATSENLRAIAFDPAGVMRVAGWSGTVIRRDPAGWHTELTSPVLFSAAERAAGQEVTVGVGSAFAIQAAATSLLERPTHRTLYGVARGPGDRLIAVGDTGTVLEYDGSRWSLVGLGETRLLRSIWTDPDDRDYAVVVGEGGLIMERRAGAWAPVASPTTKFLRHVFGISRGLLFAVGDSGTVLRGENGRWETMAAPTTVTLRGVWGSAPDDVHAVGEDGVALRFDGRRWYRLPTPTDLELRAVYGTGPTEVYAVGLGGTVLRFDGSAWIGLDSPSTAYLLSLSPGAGGITAVGTNRTVLRLEP